MNINLSKYSKEPLYEQIINEIKRNILSGDLEPAVRLPSIRQLSKDLEVSVITVKKAYDTLENENYIATIPSKGTYIAELDASIIRSKKLLNIEKEINILVQEAKSIQLSKSDFINIVDEKYEE
ncbi:GntR family transcriptional regulator [Ruoffia sp. FAM 24228]|uniref:GntR family transcriptional regulator n=1 Tax=unclassified Ruoffia TaxID=2862149 RepID=UPI003884D4FC